MVSGRPELSTTQLAACNVQISAARSAAWCCVQVPEQRAADLLPHLRAEARTLGVSSRHFAIDTMAHVPAPADEGADATGLRKHFIQINYLEADVALVAFLCAAHAAHHRAVRAHAYTGGEYVGFANAGTRDAGTRDAGTGDAGTDDSFADTYAGDGISVAGAILLHHGAHALPHRHSYGRSDDDCGALETNGAADAVSGHGPSDVLGEWHDCDGGVGSAWDRKCCHAGRGRRGENRAVTRETCKLQWSNQAPPEI